MKMPVISNLSASLRWTKLGRHFTSVSCDGQPVPMGSVIGPLDATCRLLDGDQGQAASLDAGRPELLHGPLQLELRHRLHESAAGKGEDLLEATLVVHNRSDQPQCVEVGFCTSLRPSGRIEGQRAYMPLNAAGLAADQRFSDMGVGQILKDCDQQIGSDEFQAHYLEPMASYPDQRESKALLLAPAVDLFHPETLLRIGLFTSSLEPMRFSTGGSNDGEACWQIGRCVTIPARGVFTEHCWLLLHEGDASVLWDAFHQFAHREDHPPIEWAREFKVHYYDFLSSAGGEDGCRGEGYDEDLPHFREFRVGLATQHGYYPFTGDYIHPDRKTWMAMSGDKQGPVEMSIKKILDRIKATRNAGAKAAIYIHSSLFDDAVPFFPRMRDCLQLDAQGGMMGFSWAGPDTKGKTWRASLNSPQWREHLLEQVQWIMEILKPDAIVVDETFSGLGYDHHPEHPGPLSPSAIEFYRKLRSLVRSFGSDKAVFTSDCSMSSFVMWADGECGDHAYPNLLGEPLYSQSPVRYLAALGDKPWRPCAWHFQQTWELQMALARQVGSGVGVANGWLEYSGIAGLSSETRDRLIADINGLFSNPSDRT